jgi:tetratricopeptide (TPR) repeat protein
MTIEKLERAHELLLDGVERFPKNDRLYAAAGDSFVYARGDSEGAEPYWRKAIELNPRNFSALFSLAGRVASRGSRAEALQLLRRCVEIDPKKSRARWQEDVESPLGRFHDLSQDPEFLSLLS